MLIRLFYTLLLTLLSPIFLYSLYKRKEGKPTFGSRWKEHFGFTPPILSTQKHQPIWIHAVSVGESIAAIPLIKAIKKRNPDQLIVVTTTTSTGAKQIEKLGNLVEHRYMPIDFSFAVRGFLKAINPSQMLIMETELWPNTLHVVNKAGVPISVVNARLSEKSYLNYKKFQPLLNLLSNNLTHIFCQYQYDAERFIKLGLDETRIHVTGSIKFDIDVSPETVNSGKQLRSKLGEHRPIWIAASTHKGEDEQILETHKHIIKHSPNTLLILVPRHPERFNSVFTLCEREQLITTRRTAKEPVSETTQVYLGDTMGEMLTLIAASDVCFMGGSLLGDKVGGHNIIEPIALNIPVITGASFYNFHEIVTTLEELSACTIINNNYELSEQVLSLLSDKEHSEQQSNRAYNFLLQQQGSVERLLSYII